MGEQLPVVQKTEPVVQQSDAQMGVQGNKAGPMQESWSVVVNIFYSAKIKCFINEYLLGFDTDQAIIQFHNNKKMHLSLCFIVSR